MKKRELRVLDGVVLIKSRKQIIEKSKFNEMDTVGAYASKF